MKIRILILLLVIALLFTACGYPSDSFCIDNCYHYDPIYGGQNGGK